LANQYNEIIKTFEYPDKYPTEYLFNQDGTLVFITFVYVDTVELNKPLPISIGQVWDISSPDKIHLLSTINFNYSLVYQDTTFGVVARFSEDKKTIMVCSGKTDVYIQDISTGELLSTIPDISDCRTYKDNTQMLTYDSAGNVNIWEIKNPQKPKLIWQQTENTPRVNSLQTGLDEHEVLAINSKMITSFHLSEDTAEKKTWIAVPAGSTGVAASPDGRWISSIQDGKISILDRKKRKPDWEHLYSYETHSRTNFSSILVFSPDSNQLAVSLKDGKIVVINLSTRMATLIPNEESISGLVFSLDGKSILSIDLFNGKIWDTDTGLLKNSLSDLGDIAIFHPNGKILISIVSGLRQLSLIDIDSGAVLKTIQFTSYVDGAALSPDGKMIVLNRGDKINFLDLVTGEYLATVDALVTNINFTRDGRNLLTTMWSGKILIWKVKE
jgi:WD40 repeat protein